MMANEPLAPYDQNKQSNHKLSIAKPLKQVKICHTYFPKENQVMHARIKFHAYSDIKVNT
jgi:hypothetical protein